MDDKNEELIEVRQIDEWDDGWHSWLRSWWTCAVCGEPTRVMSKEFGLPLHIGCEMVFSHEEHEVMLRLEMLLH